MKNIGKWIFSTLKNDSTIQTATGYTSSDPRIYYHYPPENITLSSTYPAYMVYFLLGSGMLGSDAIWALQRPDEIYQISIFSYVKGTTETIFERIDTLLNENLSSSITGWKVRRIYRNNQMDLYEEEDHIFHKMLEYTFSGILVSS